MGCKHVESKKHSNGQPDVVANKPVKAEPQKKEIQEVTVDVPEKKEEPIIPVKGGANIPSIREIKVIIECYSEKKFEKTYKTNAIVSDIMDDFSKETVNTFPNKNEAKWTSNGKELKKEDSLSSLLQPEESEIKIVIEVFGLYQFVNDYTKSMASDTTFLAKPIKNDGFKVMLFDRRNKTFKAERPYNMEDSEIEFFSSFSAICNGNNKLFISGGENNTGNLLNNFWIVDLTSLNLHKNQKGMPSQKKFHSMIYIPSNYVFIVGGNDKTVFYYNIEKDIFEEWADLNDTRIEPALCVVNDTYLYAFSNINKGENKLSFEKSNLRTKASWETFEPILPSNIQFNQKFFGCCYNSIKKNVIFFGGSLFNKNLTEQEEIKIPNYFEYDTISNEIKDSGIQYIESDLNEKSFIPFNDKYSFLIPNFNTYNAKIHTYNNQKNEFQTFHFENEDANISLTTKEHQDDLAKINQKDFGLNNLNKGPITKSILVPKKKYHFNMPGGMEQESVRDDQKENSNVNYNNIENNDMSNQDFGFSAAIAKTQLVGGSQSSKGIVYQSAYGSGNEKNIVIRKYVNTPEGTTPIPEENQVQQTDGNKIDNKVNN